MTDDGSAEDSERASDTETWGVVSDQPARDDQIGFETYTDALYLLLTHPGTEPPLTVSIEGYWGTGKSSLMRQLLDKIGEDHLTVEFNPWRYPDKETLWAAFVEGFIQELYHSENQKIRDKLRNTISLNWKRFRDGWSDPLFLYRVLSGLMVISFIIVIFVFIWIFGFDVIQNASLFQTESGQENGLAKFLIGSSGFIATLLALTTLSSKILSWMLAPVSFDLRQFIESPDYDSHQALISEIQKDFNRVIDSYTDNRTVFVFIDDLDRCEPSKAAELMKAISLILNTHSNVIFVIGMDREKVAAGLAAQHEKSIEYIPKLKTVGGDIESSEQIEKEYVGLEFGHNYIDKFVNIPFRVPEPKDEDMVKLLRPKTGASEESQSNPADSDTGRISSELEEKLFSGKHEFMEDISNMVSSFLNHNPRKIKKFGNLLRLQAILADKESIIRIGNNSFQTLPTLKHIAKYVAIRIEYPRLELQLRHDPTILAELESYAQKPDYPLSNDAKIWTQYDPLMELIKYGINSDQQEQYSFKNVKLSYIQRISPTIEPLEPMGGTTERREGAKKRRVRGTRTHGGGSQKNRRSAGNRGGRGNAEQSLHNEEPLGKHGFTRPEQTSKNVSELSIREIDEDIEVLLHEGVAEKTENGFSIDLRDVATDADMVKLLGSGEVMHRLEIVTDDASKSAIEKIEAAGGSVELTNDSHDTS